MNILIALNFIWLLFVTAIVFSFIGYFVTKGNIAIVKQQVMDKESSIKVAKMYEEQLSSETGDYGGKF